MINLLKRPSLYTCLIAILAYWDPQALCGKWVYDDAGSVAKNVVVNGQVPWKDAFTRDFWGTPMTEPQSHKSFRLITTLTFKLNWAFKDQEFDAAYAIEATCHAPDRVKCYKEVYRCLKPGAQFALYEWCMTDK